MAGGECEWNDSAWERRMSMSEPMRMGRTPPMPARHVLGRWGLEELVEPRLRALVAERLGVEPEERTRSVSLPDELAADSLDLLDLVLAAEEEFGVVIAERAADDIRTFGELSDVVTTRLLQPPRGRPTSPRRSPRMRGGPVRRPGSRSRSAPAPATRSWTRSRTGSRDSSNAA
jgi:acyl carrier protein